MYVKSLFPDQSSILLNFFVHIIAGTVGINTFSSLRKVIVVVLVFPSIV